jgi:uncharacterized protein (TIGR02266 family)
MTQDTRKDPRAKIVSLNVRYKSATVDEFIDNHSHDVSKGGIFIKTPSPFPPGTLLKFEIRIAGDKAVIAGVGRVVWKRETAQSNSAEQPAGMGVKFIKIDDPSRAIIDRLVDTKGGARSAYDEGGGDSSIAPPPVAEPVTSPPAPVAAKEPRKVAPKAASVAATRPPTVQPKPQAAPARSPSIVPGAKPTMLGLGSIPAGAIAASKAAAVPTPAAGRPAGDDVRRHTPQGMGAPRPGSPSTSPAGARAGSLPPSRAMFPKSNSEKEMPPTGEQTVMKQAAELLEEALRGAGGSMDEIGQNPLFDQVSSKTKDAESAAALAKLKEPSGTDRPQTVQGLGPVDVDELMKPIPELERAAAADRLRRSTPAPAAASTGTRTTPTAPKASLSPRPASAVQAVADAPPKNKWLLPVLLVAAAGGLGFFVYTQMHAVPAESPPPAPAPPVPSASASAAPSAEPSASAPAASAIPETIPSSAPDATTADASPVDAAKAAAPAAAPVIPWHPPPRKPAATAAPPPDDNDDTPPSPTTTGGSAPATPAPGSPATGVDTSATAAPPTPSTPKADDDNPY